MARHRRDARTSAYLRAKKYGVRIEQVRFDFIIKRDRSTCYLCGRVLMGYQIVFDHVAPLSRGGPHSEGNIRVACAPCNRRKGNNLPAECKWLKRSTGILILRKV